MYQLSPTDFSRQSGPARSFVIWLLVALSLVFVGLAPALANDPTRLRISGVGGNQHIQLSLNKSIIVDLAKNVSEVIVSQPSIAGAIMRNQRRAIIQGVGVGETNVLFLDANGNRIAVVEVSVTNDASTLYNAIKRILPGSQIKVDSFGERIVLSGTARSSDDVAKASAIAAQFAGSPDNVANVISISGAQQVMLKVTVAEVSRETVRQLGIDLSGSLSVGNLATSLVSALPLGGASGVINSNKLSAGFNAGGLSINATLRALERRGAMRTLASPTLTAISGGTAEFLAGGQYPVPVGIDQGQITFEFKEFGVKLKFTPTVRSNGIIALDVDTSVSEPTTEGGFSAGDITIPATKERRAKTSVEMASGSTLAIAGLIEDKVRQQFNSLPGIGNIPILGALFRSRDFVRSQTELLILVTPYMAQPGGQVRLPTDNVNFSGDAEAIFLGHMESLYGVGGNGEAGSYKGSIGFVLD
ncbi:Type II/IV secretion system secretin RcpA/CpaC, associated with Flp pilus assembly [hydrothermal vent metagenome]|uniref:Type II/IV secretion system secretin RcpA/CpaC, associated with Flp pilus assembly n=1 Tax=hydrothermal vent metagenome TaxID=652676 RepID=A0A3B0TVB8_9ZZZZ